MGYKKEYVTQSLAYQISQRLHSMRAYGESKHADKVSGRGTADRIYSTKSMQNYEVQSRLFAQWVENTHPDCASLKRARELVPEYLQYCINRGLSASTCKAYRATLNKVFRIGQDDRLFKELPQIDRTQFLRSRGEKAHDKHFSEERNINVVTLARATGGRRDDIKNLKRDNIYSREFLANPAFRKNFSEKESKMIDASLRAFPSAEYFVHFERSKGGRPRFSPIDKNLQDKVLALAKNVKLSDRILQEPIPKHADIHAYRAAYANKIYKSIARPLNEIPYDRIHKGTGHAYQSEVYHCRGNMKGIEFDRIALSAVAVALGHSPKRLEVFVSHYFRP